MKRLLLLAPLLLLGCNPAEHNPTEEPANKPPVSGKSVTEATPQPQAAPPVNQAGGNDNNVGIVSMGAGAATPVTNPQAVDGAGGGGVGSAAKDQARRVAGTAGNSSLSQMPPDGN